MAELLSAYLITGTDRPKVTRALRRLRERVGEAATEHLSAHEASGGERERSWALCNRTYAGYAAYPRRAGERRIPVLVLEPLG